tara:strand:- start:4871 stop:5344 length:474 start_codon:yes stop_codon:yes gene_type:complete
MNIAINIKNFSINNVYFLDTVKNTVMENSNFIRINYSDDIIILNGIYLSFQLKITALDKYFSKFKCSFNTSHNQFIINKIINIEKTLLNTLLNTLDYAKKPVYKIKDHISSGNIKLFSNNNNILNDTFLLKISGFWETDNEFGITYKFVGLQKMIQH